MSSIGGLTGTTSSSLNSLRGYGGLSSGMDRDSLIEGMTQGTTNRIEQQQQKKTQLQWKQTAIRNITDKMISFADKYTATMTSSTHLFSSAFWGRSNITALGANSKYVSVSGRANGVSNISIAGVKQLAEKARWTSKTAVSDRTLETGAIDPAEIQTLETLQGKTLTFKYGNTNLSIKLSGQDENGKDYKFDTLENAANSINALLKAEMKESGLDDKFKITAESTADGKLVFKTDDLGNSVKLTGGTALELLGFKEADQEFEEMDITKEGISSKDPIAEDSLTKDVSFTEKIAGKTLTFNYNGSVKSFKLPTAEELVDANGDPLTGKDLMDAVSSSLQKQFDEAYGKGRVSASVVEGQTAGTYQLKFETTTPDGNKDASSTLELVNGDAGLLGENGALKAHTGESNRLNLNAKLSEAGFAGALDFSNGPMKVKINGTEIEIKEDDTVYSLMDRINSETDLTVSYQQVGDKFSIVSKQDGASGSIQFTAADGDDRGLEAMKTIFGGDIPTDTAITGKDAILSVKYGDSQEAVDIVRGSNSIDLDGMTIGLKGTFGYDKDGNVDLASEDVTFNATVDTDKIVNALKDMVKEYNEIVELVNKEVSTRPDRNYSPLTSAQKKELSEDEIKLYEEKAKEGLLFNDSDLRSLSNALRFAINPGDLAEMEKIGITVSSSYTDNGKLTIDESKLKAALEADPESVQKMFTKTQETGADGNVTSADGIAVNLKNVMKQYANNIGTKGILIDKAGSVKSPRSITDNAIYRELESIDKKIAQLQNRLKMEQDRYIKQFSSLESLISQMNSQSDWLSQFGASY